LAIVAEWHRRFDVSEMEKNYHDAQTDWEAKEELEERMMKFVKKKMFE